MKLLKSILAATLLLPSGCAIWVRNGEHGVGNPPPQTKPEEQYLHFNSQTGQWELRDR